ncbi:MAG: methionyl-tRNA formyltransferase [Bacteroidetes bacterium]|nr:methionyl-tRNA formyltransferase [Bacteroidota bacterium]
MNSSLRIVFYGTPEFAAYSFQKIHESGFTIVGAVTAPDKPSGRGLKMHESALKTAAKNLGIEVLQPTNLKSSDFIKDLERLKPDVQVVIAFRMLPESVWSFPKYGTFNLHASLLPQYRGAAPINHAIINGEKESGVTTFFIEKEIDTGKIILQSKVSISPEDTAGTLHDKLMVEGADLVIKTLNLLRSGKIVTTVQHSENLKPAPKIFPQDCMIDWNKPASAIRNFVRGLSPYPVARTMHNEKLFKIFEIQIPETSIIPKLNTGEWKIEKGQLYIGCLDTNICVKDIQQEGKRRMKIEEFILGFRE